MPRTSCLLLAAALALASLGACQSPPPQPPGPLALKSIHVPTGHCGHHPAAPAPQLDTAR